MISVRDLVKSYPTRAGAAVVTAVDHVSFEVGRGEFFTLLGPSGCGKTTMLQCIAGLETPTSGTIEIDGRVVYCSDRKTFVPANRRNLGMVFQSYAIWPHLSVFENVAFPLVHGTRPTAAADVERRVMQALEQVKLQDYAHRPSPHLSGGQQQRVALARALVHEPSLLLLDEPLSNLDAKLRDVMRVEIRQMVKALGITTIFVTHDQLEAMSMSDTITLMRAGRIVQMGSPKDVFLRPDAAFTADFMGRSNLIPGTLAVDRHGVDTLFGRVGAVAARGLAAGAPAFLVVRPNALRVTPPGTTRGAQVFEGQIERQSFLGDIVEADIAVGAQSFRAGLDPYLTFADGDVVWVEFVPERCVAVPRESAS